MLFRLTNILILCQRIINDQLHEYLDIFVVTYLDNILIYSKTETEHIQHVKKVLDKLRRAGLLLKLEKYEFYKVELAFLGFVIRKNSIKIDLAKIKVVLSWPVPSTVKET